MDLQNLARRQGRFTQELLTMYALERFVARLANSEHAGTFVLKGGMLLAVLAARRATVDADFLATSLVNEEAAVLERVVEIASLVPDIDDGVRPDHPCTHGDRLPGPARGNAVDTGPGLPAGHCHR